jgi:transposase
MKDYGKEKLRLMKKPCPYCGAKEPVWSYNDTYPRNLISFENGKEKTYVIDITRVYCSSCGHAHAILPEMIIPYKSYSLFFIISVLRDYYAKHKIKKICGKYNISISTLYNWKKLFCLHKRLWLGVLEDIYQTAKDFISRLLNLNTSNKLEEFFLQNGYSFLQGVSKTAKYDYG